MWYVYILKCSDKTLYTGITNNIKKRLQNHNKGEGAKYTRGRGPVKLVYKESYRTQSKVLKREAEIKKYPRKKKMDLIKRQ